MHSLRHALVVSVFAVGLVHAAPAPVGVFGLKGVAGDSPYTGEVSVERDGDSLVLSSRLSVGTHRSGRAAGADRKSWLFELSGSMKSGVVGRFQRPGDGEKISGRVGARRLNLRAAPSSVSAAIGLVTQGARFGVLGRSGSWRRLKLSDGRTGWAHGAFLTLSGSVTVSALEVAPRHPRGYRARVWRNGKIQGNENWAATRGSLKEEIDAIVENTPSTFSILFEDERNKEVVYQTDAHRALVPASNMKVLTTAAALARLGSDYVYETHAVLGGRVVEGVLKGDLIVVGSGDPTLSKRFCSSEPLLESLVNAVAASGVRTIQGDLVADDRAFDRQLRHPDWSRADRQRWYGAGVSALNLGENVSGKRKPVADPARFFTMSLRDQLKARGIRVLGKLRRASRDEEIPTGAPTWTQQSPLSRVLRVILKNSHNLYAECLLKTLGREGRGQGSWARGGAVVRGFALGADVPASEVKVIDGSGLSRNNRLSAFALVRVLQLVANQPHAKAFRSFLARPGRAGTLRRRLSGLPAATVVTAKTGTLTGVASLSGYLEGGNRRLSFAIIANGKGHNKKAIDAIVQAVAQHLAATAT